MSKENISKFIELVRTSPELQDKLSQLIDAPQEAASERIAAFGNQLGFPFTAAEFHAATATVLSDEDLNAVSGGIFPALVALFESIKLSYSGPDIYGCARHLVEKKEGR